MLHKILHILRLVIAWTLIIVGGFYCFISLLCFVLAVFGKLEIESLKDTLVVIVCFLLIAVLSGAVCKLGFWLRGKAPKKTAAKPLSEQKEDVRAKRNDPPAPLQRVAREETQHVPAVQKLSEKKATVQAAMDTFPPEKQKQFEAQFYQYTQDVGRGGLEPEVAAANRGLVFVDGRPVHAEVAARMAELEGQNAAEQKPNTPYQRAKMPYEVAGPHRSSLLGEESQYFILLSETKLAPELGWGQSEYFAVDTRTWQPYYIIEQYDGAAAAQSWYEVKEKVTWDEVEQYADANRKYELNYATTKAWSKQIVNQNLSDSHFSISWRMRSEGYNEAAVWFDGTKLELSMSWQRGPSDPSGKSKCAELTPQICADEAKFREEAKRFSIYKDYILTQLWTFVRKKTEQMRVTAQQSAHCGFDLAKAVESGDVGQGNTSQHWEGPTIYITTTATNNVRYYYFDDGLLVFAGKGAAKCVDPGGHDGRHAYEPETPPWSERVQNGATRAVFTEGITVVGSGLLDSLKNLEVLELADSVTAVHYTHIRNVHTLRTGANFRSFRGFTAPLTELQVPEGKVHFEYFNSGSLPGVTSKDPKIQAVLDEKLRLEFADVAQELFRDCPGVAQHLESMPQYDRQFCTRMIFSLGWNSQYKKNRRVPKADLDQLLNGAPNQRYRGKTLEVTLKHNYGIHDFMMVAALAYAAVMAKPGKILCSIDYMQLSGGIFRWWSAEFPEIPLHIVRKDNVNFTTEGTGGIHENFSQRKQVLDPQSSGLIEAYENLFLFRDEIGHRDWIGIDTRNGNLYGMRLRKSPYYDTRDFNEPEFFTLHYANLPELIAQAPQEEFILGVKRYRKPTFYASMTKDNWETYLAMGKIIPGRPEGDISVVQTLCDECNTDGAAFAFEKEIRQVEVVRTETAWYIRDLEYSCSSGANGRPLYWLREDYYVIPEAVCAEVSAENWKEKAEKTPDFRYKEFGTGVLF